MLTLSVTLSGQPPKIDRIAPPIAYSGDILVLEGRHFGTERSGSDLSIAGIIPTASSYLEWTDRRISVRVPEDVQAGLVYVITDNGKSNGMLFTNKTHIPVVLSGPAKAGFPYVESLEPKSGSIGSTVIISGRNFGVNRRSSRVYFSWTPADKAVSGETALSAFLPGSDFDFDYLSWSDREIHVRVPNGAVSGNMFVTTETGESNAVYFEVFEEVGSRIFHEKLTYAIQYSVDVDGIRGGPGSTLYLWVPRVFEGPAQREVQLINQEPMPQFENYRGLILYRLSDLQEGQSYRVSQNFIFDRYTEETRIRPDQVARQYDTESELYRAYTVPSAFVPSDHPAIRKQAAVLAGREKNPYLVAKSIYRFLVDGVEIRTGSREEDPVAMLETKKGTSYGAAILFCALARSAGIPSRTVTGYLVDDAKQAIRHFWAEFYLERFGWVPVDPLLGKGGRPADFEMKPEPGEFSLREPR